MSKFSCQRCQKSLDIEERGKKTIPGQGICVKCCKKIGIYKEVSTVTRKPKKKKKKRWVPGLCRTDPEPRKKIR